MRSPLDEFGDKICSVELKQEVTHKQRQTTISLPYCKMLSLPGWEGGRKKQKGSCENVDSVQQSSSTQGGQSDRLCERERDGREREAEQIQDSIGCAGCFSALTTDIILFKGERPTDAHASVY